MIRSTYVGRPPRDLIEGDVTVSQPDQRVQGVIEMRDGKPWVKWEDREEATPVRGMILTTRRTGEVLPWEK